MITIPKENWQAMKKMNEQSERQLHNAKKEIEKLKGQLELLKKFSLLGEIFYEIKNLQHKR